MNWAAPLIYVHTDTHGSKDQKRLSMRNVDRPSNHMLIRRQYNFLIINATSQKAHHARKKP
jgi:N-acetyl-anhydromuramyl-L-alanine amidase AmpD